MTIPFLSGFALPGQIDNIAKNAQELFNPNKKYIDAMRAQMAQDPDFFQKLTDAESLNPGYIEQMFGKKAAQFFGGGSASAAAGVESTARANLNTPYDKMPTTVAGQAASRKLLGKDTLDIEGQKGTNEYYEQGRKLQKIQLKFAEPMAEAQLIKAQDDVAQIKRQQGFMKIADDTIKAAGGVQPLVRRLVQDALSGKNATKLKDDVRAALFSQPEFKAEYDREFQARQFQLSEWRAQNALNNQRADQREMLARQEAQLDAALAGKMGFDLSGTRLFDIRKNDWENALELFKTSPETLKSANPSLYNKFKSDPTYLNTWEAYKSATSQSQDMQRNRFEQQYFKKVNEIVNWAKPGKNKKGATQQEVSARIVNELVPLQKQIKTMGGEVSLPVYNPKKAGLWDYITGDASGTELVAPTPENPTVEANKIPSPSALDQNRLNQIRQVVQQNIANNPGETPATVLKAMLDAGAITQQEYAVMIQGR